MQFTITSIVLALAATAVNATPTPEMALTERANSWKVRVSNNNADQCPGGSSYSGTGSQGCTLVPESTYISASATGSCYVYSTDDATCGSGGYGAYEGAPINCFPGVGWKAFYVEC